MADDKLDLTIKTPGLEDLLREVFSAAMGQMDKAQAHDKAHARLEERRLALAERQMAAEERRIALAEQEHAQRVREWEAQEQRRSKGENVY